MFCPVRCLIVVFSGSCLALCPPCCLFLVWGLCILCHVLFAFPCYVIGMLSVIVAIPDHILYYYFLVKAWPFHCMYSCDSIEALHESSKKKKKKKKKKYRKEMYLRLAQTWSFPACLYRYMWTMATDACLKFLNDFLISPHRVKRCCELLSHKCFYFIVHYLSENDCSRLS